MKRLWEVEHPYHCSPHDYYRPPSETLEYETIDEFLLEFGDSDIDMNYVFRWDWHTDAGESMTLDRVEIFFIKQRKGIFMPVIVTHPSRDDEPKLRKFLEKHWHLTQKLWDPFQMQEPKTLDGGNSR